jgi:hypothetical protein
MAKKKKIQITKTIALPIDDVILLDFLKCGMDVYSYQLAKRVREFDKKNPGLVEIVPAMEAPKDGAKRQPYFGVITGPRGREFIVAAGFANDDEDWRVMARLA